MWSLQARDDASIRWGARGGRTAGENVLEFKDRSIEGDGTVALEDICYRFAISRSPCQLVKETVRT